MNKDISNLPLLHDPLVNDRVRIETIDGWQILGSNRGSPAYEGFFRRGDTPVQLLYIPSSRFDNGRSVSISILTPCRATGGKFEIVIGEAPPIRKCCYKCVCAWIKNCAGLTPPSHKEWIPYMLLECFSFMHGSAPKEKARR